MLPVLKFFPAPSLKSITSPPALHSHILQSLFGPVHSLTDLRNRLLFFLNSGDSVSVLIQRKRKISLRQRKPLLSRFNLGFYLFFCSVMKLLFSSEEPNTELLHREYVQDIFVCFILYFL